MLYHGASSRCHVRLDETTLLAVARAESAARRALPAAGLAGAARVAAGEHGPARGGLSRAAVRLDVLRSGRNAFYLSLLLVPPLLWLGTVYLGSLFALLAQSFYAIDEFTARVVPEPTLATYRQLFTQPANVDIVRAHACSWRSR